MQSSKLQPKNSIVKSRGEKLERVQRDFKGFKDLEKKTLSSEDQIRFRGIQPALIPRKMNRSVGHSGDRMQTLLISKCMKENASSCLLRWTKPCSLSSRREWQLLTRGRFSVAEIIEDKIQFALGDNVENVLEEGG